MVRFSKKNLKKFFKGVKKMTDVIPRKVKKKKRLF